MSVIAQAENILNAGLYLFQIGILSFLYDVIDL